ncbi:MAG TPA: hypothetical protein VK982_00100 [Bacteroidales bacterium]|nr:hypothetical protein [Bacteroidales bacterium]
MERDKNFFFLKKVLLNCRQIVNIALRNFIVNTFRVHIYLPKQSEGRAQLVPKKLEILDFLIFRAFSKQEQNQICLL